jgi:ABC-type phosphate transport system permease subunit
MKNALNFLGWIGVIFTIAALVLTLLTTYQFLYISYFNGYYTLQLCMALTMAIWSVNMFVRKKDFKNFLYPLTCVLIACVTMFFIYMRVY